MKNLLLRALARVIEADDSGFAVNRQGRKLYDAQGIEAEEKDLQRLRDIKSKAAGNEFKVLQLAQQMAKSITDSDKALRRASAAEQIFKGTLCKLKLVKIFEDRADEIDG
jgi:hypothetical protein